MIDKYKKEDIILLFNFLGLYYEDKELLLEIMDSLHELFETDLEEIDLGKVEPPLEGLEEVDLDTA